jgi:hypothetical protein
MLSKDGRFAFSGNRDFHKARQPKNVRFKSRMLIHSGRCLRSSEGSAYNIKAVLLSGASGGIKLTDRYSSLLEQRLLRE